jgi:hypothetical protein
MSTSHLNILLAYLMLAALLAIGLAGCTTPAPRVVTKEVRVPVAVSCAPTPLQLEPVYAADAASLDGTIFDLVQTLLIDREQRKISELSLRAALEGCR